MPDRTRAFDAIVAGELYIDLILSGFEFWPQPGQEAFAKEFHRGAGGGAATTARTLAMLGSRAAVLGIVGHDGDWLLQQFERSQVDISLITRDSTEPTAFTVAVSTPEDRSFLTYPGANRGFPAAIAEAAAAKVLTQAAHVHLAYPPELSTARDLLAAIRANGCTVSLDVGWHEDWLRDSRLPDLLPLLDAFFPNEAEAFAITRENEPETVLRWFAEAGLRRVALKLGARGAALFWDGEIWFDVPPRVTCVDTTGAGDCFNGGFLHSWLMGDAPAICLRTANVCGALSTEAYGGAAGLADRTRFHEILRARS
jgi:sugar/nucleoside kinase (ribokinase family)